SDVLSQDRGHIALAGEADATVPEYEQVEKAFHSTERLAVEFDVKPSRALPEERCLGRRHVTRVAFYSWESCEGGLGRFPRRVAGSDGPFAGAPRPGSRGPRGVPPRGGTGAPPPITGAHRVESDGPAGLLRLLGEPTRQLVQILPPPLPVALYIHHEAGG